MPKRGGQPLQGDLLQGTLDLLILQTLVLGPAHGHTIAHAIARRSDKQAFAGVDTGVWLQGPLKSLLERSLDFNRLKILDPAKTRVLLDRFKQGDRTHVRLVWRLAALQRWMEVA